MKALTLCQPWASLVAIGAKRIETRSWQTTYTGLLAIHASKRFPLDCKRHLLKEPFSGELLRGGYGCGLGYVPHAFLPLGSIVAVAHVVDCISTTNLQTNMVGTAIRTRRGYDLIFSAAEHAFGDYTPGRFGFVLAHVHRLAEPIPCRGALGLWDVPADVEAEIRRQTGAI